jgi:hypothetical protein
MEIVELSVWPTSRALKLLVGVATQTDKIQWSEVWGRFLQTEEEIEGCTAARCAKEASAEEWVADTGAGPLCPPWKGLEDGVEDGVP